MDCDACRTRVETAIRGDQIVCARCSAVLAGAALVSRERARSRPRPRATSAVAKAIKKYEGAVDATPAEISAAAMAAGTQVAAMQSGRRPAGASRVAARVVRETLREAAEQREAPDNLALAEAYLADFEPSAAGKAAAGGRLLAAARTRRGACTNAEIMEETWCLAAVGLAVLGETPPRGATDDELHQMAADTAQRLRMAPRCTCVPALVELLKHAYD